MSNIKGFRPLLPAPVILFWTHFWLVDWLLAGWLLAGRGDFKQCLGPRFLKSRSKQLLSSGCFLLCFLTLRGLGGHFWSLLGDFGTLFADYGGHAGHFGDVGIHFDVFWLHLGSLGGSLGGTWAHLGAPGVHFNVPWASKTCPKWSRMPFG